MRAWAALAVALASGCTDLRPDPREALAALPTTVPAPADNPTTPAAVELGRLLFWDPILSGGQDVACATCHHPDFGYADGLPRSIGVGGRGVGPARAVGTTAPRTPRNAPTVLATAWNGFTSQGAVAPEQAPMFWDNRARSLEAQVLGPMRSQVEMRGTTYREDEIVDVVVARLAAIPAYATRFTAAFGADGVTASTMARALAAFERTLVPVDASFDRYMRGDDDALTAEQIRGLHGFVYQGCTKCHSGPMLSDFALHELPVPPVPGEPEDLGNGLRQFRTPSLRMVTLTAPYMHNGAAADFGEVFDFYHNVEVTDPLLGGDVEPPHGGGDELILFLHALSDGQFDRTIPASVPSGLPPGGP